MTNPEIHTPELAIDSIQTLVVVLDAISVRGLTIFDEDTYANAGSYKPTASEDKGVLVVESFNAYLQHLGKIATFTRWISDADYVARFNSYLQDPDAFYDWQIKNLKK